MASHVQTESAILASLESLVGEPGFVYTLALVSVNDLFFAAEEAADINWHERLSFQELTLLAGQLACYPIDTSVLPTEQIAKEQTSELYGLFGQLHDAHSRPMVESLQSKFDEMAGRQDADSITEESFSRGSLMVEPIFYSGSGAYDFQYLDLAVAKYQRDQEWIQRHAGLSTETMVRAAAELKRLHMRKVSAFREAESFREVCEAALETFSFRRGDLVLLNDEEFDAFIRAFSLVPGSVDHPPATVGATNEVEFKPILALDQGRFFIPIGFNLTKSIYESPYYWMLR